MAGCSADTLAAERAAWSVCRKAGSRAAWWAARSGGHLTWRLNLSDHVQLHYPFALLILSVAAATTFSAVKPNSLKRTEALAEAPKCSSEIAMP